MSKNLQAYAFKLINTDYVGVVFGSGEVDIFWLIDRFADPYACKYRALDDREFRECSSCCNVTFEGDEVQQSEFEGGFFNGLTEEEFHEWKTFDADFKPVYKIDSEDGMRKTTVTFLDDYNIDNEIEFEKILLKKMKKDIRNAIDPYEGSPLLMYALLQVAKDDLVNEGNDKDYMDECFIETMSFYKETRKHVRKRLMASLLLAKSQYRLNGEFQSSFFNRWNLNEDVDDYVKCLGKKDLRKHLLATELCDCELEIDEYLIEFSTEKKIMRKYGQYLEELRRFHIILMNG